jgi:hypothetical protein
VCAPWSSASATSKEATVSRCADGSGWRWSWSATLAAIAPHRGVGRFRTAVGTHAGNRGVASRRTPSCPLARRGGVPSSTARGAWTHGAGPDGSSPSGPAPASPERPCSRSGLGSMGGPSQQRRRRRPVRPGQCRVRPPSRPVRSARTRCTGLGLFHRSAPSRPPSWWSTTSCLPACCPRACPKALLRHRSWSTTWR